MRKYPNLTEEQFTALSKIARFRDGSPCKSVVRSVFVLGKKVREAADDAGVSYNAAHQAVSAARDRVGECRRVAGADSD